MNFRNLRHGQTCVDHLLDAPRALRVAQVALLVVGDDLVHDAVDRLGGGICCRRGEDVDRNRGQTDFARRDGSTLPVVLYPVPVLLSIRVARRSAAVAVIGQGEVTRWI